MIGISFKQIAVRAGLALALVTGMSTAGWAACNQPNLKGTWQFYALGTDGSDSSIVSCTLSVNKNGKVANSSSCTETVVSENESMEFNVQAGQLKLAKSCKLTGHIRFDGCRHNIADAWVSTNKKALEGIGESCGGGIFKFSGLKR